MTKHYRYSKERKGGDLFDIIWYSLLSIGVLGVLSQLPKAYQEEMELRNERIIKEYRKVGGGNYKDYLIKVCKYSSAQADSILGIGNYAPGKSIEDTIKYNSIEVMKLMKGGKSK